MPKSVFLQLFLLVIGLFFYSGNVFGGTPNHSICLEQCKDIGVCVNHGVTSPGLSTKNYDWVCEPSGKQKPPQQAEEETKAEEVTPTDAVAACEQQVAKVDNDCDARKDPDISKAMDVAKQVASSMTNDAAMACSAIGTLVTGASAALATYEGICKMSLESCESACDPKLVTDTDQKNILSQRKKDCSKLSKETQPDLRFVKNALQSSQTNCAGLLGQIGAKGLIGAADSSDCNANPTNPVCVCYKNPAACANLKTGGLDTGSAGLGSGVEASAGTGGVDSKLGPMPFLPEEMSGAPDGKGNFQGVNQSPGGRGGGGFGGGDSGGGGGKGRPAVAAKPGADTNIYKGTLGGNGGSFGSSGGKGYQDANGSGRGTGYYAANGTVRPDFSKFYPNMKYDPGRGLAGSGSSGPDGITGPTTNLFVKVNNQFKSQGGKSFLP